MKSKLLKIIAFISGMAVMAFEISASRLLSPFFGASQFVWTNVIAVALGALSLGYYLGGRFSEKFGHLKALLRIIFFAGLFCLFLPWLALPLHRAALRLHLPEFLGQSYGIFGSLFFSVLIFGLPLAMLGMAAPLLVKLESKASGSAGRASGNIFAWSTIGSIIGTFLPTFLFLPLFGTRVSIAVFALLLVFLGSLSFAEKGAKALLVLLALFFLYPAAKVSLNPHPSLLDEKDSAYQLIQVLSASGGAKYIKVNEGISYQSFYMPGQDFYGGFYDSFAVLPHLLGKTDKIKMLVIGLAGGTLVRSARAEFKDRLIAQAVEIDPVMTVLANKYFDLSELGVKIMHMDGRIFLLTNREKFNYIVIDAFQNEKYIPWTMVSKEFWQAVKSGLEPGGVVAVNLVSGSNSTELFKIFNNTMAAVFPFVGYSRTPDAPLNFVVLASDKKFDINLFRNVEAPPLYSTARNLFKNFKPLSYNPAEKIFTDDWAPVEHLTQSALEENLYKLKQ